MNIVNLSLDPKVLENNSVVVTRIKEYGKKVENYTVIVPGKHDDCILIEQNISVYSVGGFTKIVKFFRIYSTVVKLINKGKCDVISTDQYYLGLIGYLLAKKYHLGFEVQALGFEKLNVIRKMLARFLFKKASVIRVNSPRLVVFLRDFFDIYGDKVKMIPIYVNTKLMGINEPLTNQSDLNKKALYIKEYKKEYGDCFNFISVNRLVSVKNISLQIQAMYMLIKKFPKVCLHIVGDGPEYENIKTEIEKLSLKKNVFLHGYAEGISLGVYYSESDCFLLTSNSEGWGMVIIEALQAYLPVIMTDVGCAGEVIIHEESGIVVPVNDVHATCNAMLSIVKDSSYREKLISGGEKSLQKLLSLEEILSLYTQSWKYSLENKL